MPKRQGIVISETMPAKQERDLDTWLNPTLMEFRNRNPVTDEWELSATGTASNPPADMKKADNLYIDQEGNLVIVSDE